MTRSKGIVTVCAGFGCCRYGTVPVRYEDRNMLLCDVHVVALGLAEL